MSLDVITFGEAMLLLVADRPGPIEQAEFFHKRTAGAETNVAIGLARLGLRVGWASRLGTDSMGRALLATMQAEGIDCSHVVCDATQRTGLAAVPTMQRRVGLTGWVNATGTVPPGASSASAQ